ncbi:hypothetical protein [Clostridium sp.]|uniref:hypothetical protein n=1 Tax=Clostridium sp. TaxID=1506 RepID=UPI001A5530B1|nr:hypothetical protein [Clostridium sp.]MBK5234235.1 hypothetical protein [Clostridium sp.]
MLEDNEIYNSIIREFDLSGSILDGMKEAVEALTKSRMDICNILKIPNVCDKTIDWNEKKLIKNINTNKSKIKDCQRKQIELKDRIKDNKKETKVIKSHINILEDKLLQEKQQSKELNQNLRIFLRREKFKFIKKVLYRSYRKVFLKYYNELSVKTKINECNKRKEKIRGEKENFSNSIDRYNRKIIIDKIALAEKRKSIINMERNIDFFSRNLQSLTDYKEMVKNFGQKLNDMKS